jgi:phosphopantetheinyl transferase
MSLLECQTPGRSEIKKSEPFSGKKWALSMNPVNRLATDGLAPERSELTECEIDSVATKPWWSLVRIDKSTAPWEWLTPSEQKEYKSLKSEKRRAEWLAARMLVKRIVLSNGVTDSPRKCVIFKQTCGRPVVRVSGPDGTFSMNCSMSHRKGWIAVCVSPFPQFSIGIDVEVISKVPWQVQDAFANTNDDILGARDDYVIYTILWACKEAAAKASIFGVPFCLGEFTIRDNGAGCFTALRNEFDEAMYGMYFRHDEAILALCQVDLRRR